MAAEENIPIPLTMPRCEALALAQFSGTEADVMWSGVNLLRSALADAGFAPR
jgi:hypothetical protein